LRQNRNGIRLKIVRKKIEGRLLLLEKAYFEKKEAAVLHPFRIV
jgi:hypothetical protein